MAGEGKGKGIHCIGHYGYQSINSMLYLGQNNQLVEQRPPLYISPVGILFS